MIKIVITGVESSGKSTLAEKLSLELQIPLISEYSREYLTKRNGYYTQEDLLEISRVQLSRELLAAERKVPAIICDTSLLVMKVWSLYKYDSCDAWISRQLKKHLADVYLLPHYDIPYEDDPLRENPYDRDVLYTMYLKELEQLEANFHVLSGCLEERIDHAKDIITTLPPAVTN